MKIKIILLGRLHVGKTTLLRNISKQELRTHNDAPYLVNLQVALTDNQVDCEIWDSGGSERYTSIAPIYYRNTDSVAVIFDVTNRESFDQAKYWCDQVKEHVPYDVGILIVGNKVDLADQRVVPKEEAEQLAAAEGATYLEITSMDKASCLNFLRSIVNIGVAKNKSRPKTSGTLVLNDGEPADEPPPKPNCC
mmetsp:Transcript_8529/g.14443  ORF Transcript_8529/g.14443 Transcript_8529/m.14443 type:complete len:193 (-) Transcript_8529:11-589(-)